MPWPPVERDMTTGLLLEDTSAPAGADEDSGQLGQLRKRLTLLQGSQARSASPYKQYLLYVNRSRVITVAWEFNMQKSALHMAMSLQGLR